MFTTGRLTFAFCFLIAFVIALIWAYRKDFKKSPWFFKGSLKIVLIIAGLYLTYYISVRYVL